MRTGSSRTRAEMADRGAGRWVSGRGIGLGEVALLALLLMAGLLAWSVGIVERGYDYDEVQRAHSIWLASAGLRPYVDFFECHPPYFVLLSPLLGLFGDPADALQALRIFSAAGSLLFFAGVSALALPPRAPGRRRRWAWLVLGLVAFHPAVLSFLVEFRIDDWGYALAIWSLVRYRRSDRGVSASLELGVASGLATLLLAPKIALLPPLVVLFDQLGPGRSTRRAVRTALGYAAGLGLSVILFGLYLRVSGIEIARVRDLMVRYNATSNATSGFGYGLLHQTLVLWPLLLLAGAGVAGSVVESLRRRALPDPLEPALAVWLASQIVLVSYPYKQYYAPWFLLASIFLVLRGRALESLPRRFSFAIIALACCVSVPVSYTTAREWLTTGEAASQRALIRWMNRVVPAGDRVVASPPYHPIARRDTFFIWFNTFDPGGFDSDRILAGFPELRTYATSGRYRAELESHPPALVGLGSERIPVLYTPLQRSVMNEFLPERGYKTVRVGGQTFALRPDRFEYAGRSGLLN